MRLSLCSVFINPFGVGIVAAQEYEKSKYIVQELFFDKLYNSKSINEKIMEFEEKYTSKPTNPKRTTYDFYGAEVPTKGKFSGIGCNEKLDNFSFDHTILGDLNSEAVSLKLSIGDGNITFSGDKREHILELLTNFDPSESSSESFVLVNSLFLLNHTIKELPNSVLWYLNIGESEES